MTEAADLRCRHDGGQDLLRFAEESLGAGWEVLNAGISGYRTLNVYRLLKLRIQAFDPDAIVIDCMPYDSPRDEGGPLEGSALQGPMPMKALGSHSLIAEWGREHGVEVFFMEYPIMDEALNHGCKTGKGELPEGSRIVPTCQRLPALNPRASELFQDRNHLTEEGNRLVGGIVADSIREWAAGNTATGR